MQTIEQAYKVALAKNDIVAIKALTDLINELNSDLHEQGILFAHVLPKESETASYSSSEKGITTNATPLNNFENTRPLLKALLRSAIDNRDALLYQKYFALAKKVEARLNQLNLSEFNLEQEFAAAIDERFHNCAIS